MCGRTTLVNVLPTNAHYQKPLCHSMQNHPNLSARFLYTTSLPVVTPARTPTQQRSTSSKRLYVPHVNINATTRAFSLSLYSLFAVIMGLTNEASYFLLNYELFYLEKRSTELPDFVLPYLLYPCGSNVRDCLEIFLLREYPIQVQFVEMICLS